MRWSPCQNSAKNIMESLKVKNGKNSKFCILGEIISCCQNKIPSILLRGVWNWKENIFVTTSLFMKITKMGKCIQ